MALKKHAVRQGMQALFSPSPHFLYIRVRTQSEGTCFSGILSCCLMSNGPGLRELGFLFTLLGLGLQRSLGEQKMPWSPVFSESEEERGCAPRMMVKRIQDERGGETGMTQCTLMQLLLRLCRCIAWIFNSLSPPSLS